MAKPKYMRSDATRLAHAAATTTEILRRAALSQKEIAADDMPELCKLLTECRWLAERAYAVMHGGRNVNRHSIAASVTDCGRPRSSPSPS